MVETVAEVVAAEAAAEVVVEAVAEVVAAKATTEAVGEAVMVAAAQVEQLMALKS